MNPVDVSVLTPVLNEERHIRGVAMAMRGQQFDGSIELLFIDGGSRDRTVEILNELANDDDRIRVLENPRRTTPIALNLGLRASRGDYVARMDAHTEYPPGYLAAGVERLRRGGVAHVSGPQLPHGTGKWSRRVATALSTRLGTGEADFRHRAGDELEVDTGFTGVWRRSTLERQGGWDEGWPNDQDTELAARIRKDGGRIVCLPEMAALYIPRDSLFALGRQYWRYGVYRAKTAGRHPESMRRSQVLVPGLALTAIVAPLPLGRLARAARAGLAAYLLALGMISAGQARTVGAREAAWLPAIFACMHLPYGFGFLAGSLRFGPPLTALLRLARGRGLTGST